MRKVGEVSLAGLIGAVVGFLISVGTSMSCPFWGGDIDAILVLAAIPGLICGFMGGIIGGIIGSIRFQSVWRGAITGGVIGGAIGPLILPLLVLVAGLMGAPGY